ncbi:MAG TPA: hypothetical protein VEZ48_12970 [Sphingomonadaceae bacterium]|nr:hypothetical protein [Sphingomonadaceae bacterium]
MTDSKAGEIGGGTNSRPLDDTIAGTGPGISDDALTPGQDMPEPPSEEEQRRIAAKLGVELPDA